MLLQELLNEAASKKIRIGFKSRDAIKEAVVKAVKMKIITEEEVKDTIKAIEKSINSDKYLTIEFDPATKKSILVKSIF